MSNHPFPNPHPPRRRSSDPDYFPLLAHDLAAAGRTRRGPAPVSTQEHATATAMASAASIGLALGFVAGFLAGWRSAAEWL